MSDDAGTPMHPSVKDVLRYFKYDHLREPLASKSRKFAELAHEIAGWAPNSPQTTHALHNLLAAKDAAVRASLPNDA